MRAQFGVDGRLVQGKFYSVCEQTESVRNEGHLHEHAAASERGF